MKLFILPVSGGKFVSQLAQIKHLCKYKIFPDLIFASSGGNVVSYLGMAAGWNVDQLEKILEDISSEMIIEKMKGIRIMNFINAYYKGYIFNNGQGVKKFFHKNFNTFNIIETEIWTGTYNDEKFMERVFCNREKKDSFFKDEDFNHTLRYTLPPYFCNGDVEKIATVSTASANIPVFLPGVIIDNEKYVDGGLGNSSPLKSLSNSLVNTIEKNDDSLHIFYFNSFNSKRKHGSNYMNILTKWKEVTDTMVSSYVKSDLIFAYDIFLKFSKNYYELKFPLNECNGNFIKKIQKVCEYSILELYLDEMQEVDIFNFQYNDLINKLDKAYNLCNCIFWFNKNKEVDQIVKNNNLF